MHLPELRGGDDGIFTSQSEQGFVPSQQIVRLGGSPGIQDGLIHRVGQAWFQVVIGFDEVRLEGENIDQVGYFLGIHTMPVFQLGQHTRQLIEDVMAEHDFE